MCFNPLTVVNADTVILLRLKVIVTNNSICITINSRVEVSTVSLSTLLSQECVKTLAVLEKCSDVSLAKSLCYLSWQPKDGKVNVFIRQ